MAEQVHRLKVLLLSSHEPSTQQLREILDQHVLLATAWTREELFHLVLAERYDAFLCDKDFCRGDCQEFCHDIKDLAPNIPTIVVSRFAEEKEWAEVLKAGCFDLLVAPYSARSVLAVVEHAVASGEALAWGIVA